MGYNVRFQRIFTTVEKVTTVMTRKTTTTKFLRRSLVETRDKIQGETDLATQVEGVGQIVNTCVDALQEEMDECRRGGLTDDNLSKIRDLKTVTTEVETVYLEYATVVQQIVTSMRRETVERISKSIVVVRQ